ncbi:MAG: DUF6036 family nucleotidyltransferase [Rhodothermales bacterium]
MKYMIVGGEAVIFYGHVRLTGDVDFFYSREHTNVQRLFATLIEFWSGTIPGVGAVADLAVKGQIIQFGVPPNRIDLINDVDGIDFESAWSDRMIASVRKPPESVPVLFIGRQHLIQNKRASGRPKDLEDLRFLEGSS